jgi:hypothetical protein
MPTPVVSMPPMNATQLHSTRIPGFKVIPKRRLGDFFHESQSAFYVLLGRRGAPEAPRERVVFVAYLDDFLESCQQQIEELWAKHRVMITHVAVKLGRPFHTSGTLTEAYERALAVQDLRHKLNPRFRRL